MHPLETRELAGFPGYFATQCGVVYGKRGNPLSQWLTPCGYRDVKVGAKHMGVHRAVALAWIGNPDGLSDVNHMDGNKLNNSAANLEWCSRTQNIRHSLDTGLHAMPETPVYGFSDATGVAVWARSQAEVRHFGFLQSLVNKCLRGERNHHRGYSWSYAA